MTQNTKNKLWPLSLSVLVVALDQITKALVVKYIPLLTPFSDNGIIEIFGKYLRLIHVRNKAVAFSMGAGLPDSVRFMLFSVLSLMAVIIIYIVYFRNNEFTKLQRWALCGILGGGLGNLVRKWRTVFSDGLTALLTSLTVISLEFSDGKDGQPLT